MKLPSKRKLITDLLADYKFNQKLYDLLPDALEQLKEVNACVDASDITIKERNAMKATIATIERLQTSIFLKASMAAGQLSRIG